MHRSLLTTQWNAYEHGEQSLPPMAAGHGRTPRAPAAPFSTFRSSRFLYLLNLTHRSSKTCADSPYSPARWWHNRHTRLPDCRCDALRILDAHKEHRGECHTSRISSPYDPPPRPFPQEHWQKRETSIDPLCEAYMKRRKPQPMTRLSWVVRQL